MLEGWVKNVGTEDGFEKSWIVVEQNAEYSFNASHSVSVALDSIYGAWLKAKYPYEYYTVAFNMYDSDLDMTKRLADELSYFNIKLNKPSFRHSKGEYSFNKELKQITKGIGSIKNLNSNVGDELYELRNNIYSSFVELLCDVKEKTSCNSRQLEILIKCDFFKEFGNARYLMEVVNLFQWIDKKQVSKDKVGDSPFNEDLFVKYSNKQTDKQFREIDFKGMIEEVVSKLDVVDYSISEKMSFQEEHVGYIDLVMDVDSRYVYVSKVEAKFTPKLKLYSLGNGKTLEMKLPKELAKDIKVGDIIYLHKVKQKPRWMPDGTDAKGKTKFKMHPTDKEWWIENYEKRSEHELTKTSNQPA